MAHIHKIPETEWPEVYAMEKECFSDSPWTPKQIQDHLKYQGGIAYRKEGELLGYILYLESLDFTEIFRIGVSPQFRKQGVGKSMIEYLQKKLSKGKVILEVADSNRTALEFYSSLGFEENGRRKNYYSDGSSAILMELSV